MRRLRSSFRALLFAGLALVSVLEAQQGAQPHIGYIFPAGGQKGTTFTVLIGGQNIDAVSDVLVTGGGFSAKVVEQSKPLSNKEFILLKDRLQALREKKRAALAPPAKPVATQANSAPATEAKPAPQPFTAEDQKQLDEILAKVSKYERKPANPNIAETATLLVTLEPDARTGERELRLLTKSGLTNPMIFQVGELPETTEPANDKTVLARKPTDITLPRTVNGQILPGAADRYRFSAKKGQRIVIAAFARTLIPYLADAVPGWFQATLAFYDDAGKELAYDDDYNFNPDPVLSYTIPRDGVYQFEIKDSIYRGREDFAYRVFVGELSFVTGIFPLGARAGMPTPVQVRGWNLPGDRVTATVAEPGLQQISARTSEMAPNRASFQVDTLPERLEREPNDDRAHAETVELPLILNGRIDRPGDFDCYAFQGKAGDTIVAEVLARRLDSPLDSNLALFAPDGSQIAFNDDHEDKGSGLNTHHADSYLLVRLPATGTYLVKIGDTQRSGGDEYSYRLRLGPPRPDFDLRVVPSSANVRSGGTMTLSVYALRKDGFSGEIALSIKDAPAGFALSGARIPEGQDQVRMTLTAPRTFFNGPVSLSFEGKAEIGDRKVSRDAVPAEDMMQAFLYRHLVPSQRFVLAVSGKSPLRTPALIEGKGPVRLTPGGTQKIKVSVPPNLPRGKVRLALSDPPEGIELTDVREVWGGRSELVLSCDAAKTHPGLAGNLIVEIYLDREGQTSKTGTKGPKKQNGAPIDILPAIPFLVIPR